MRTKEYSIREMTEPEYVITSLEDAPEQELDQIHAGLLAFNEAHAGPAGLRRVRLLVRDVSGVVKAGLIGRHLWGWLQIDILWVDEGLRRNGWGSRLLAQAENEARKAGCTRAVLDTFEFQAPAFYEKRGYSRFAILEDFPPGYRRY